MTDEEIRRIAKETETPECVIRTALPLIPVDKHSEWIGLLKSDNPAARMARSYGWTVQHAISYLEGTPTPPRRKRLRFRFTIRDLLWLTLVVALVLGWWIDQRTLRDERAADQRTIYSLKIALQDQITMHDPATYKKLADEVLELREQLKGAQQNAAKP
jgi:hypothetical protein